MKTVIVDYEAGNLKSVANMLTYLKTDFEITDNPKKILSADKIIFPGQGHFGQAMNNLERKGLADSIREAVAKDIPFLGICIGLQILFESSKEAPDVKGLGILEGEVKRFTKGKIPQIGWNKISTTKADNFLKNDYFYFVNSYYVKPKDKNIISSMCDYNGNFCASVQKNNLTAVQFHPEKSSTSGLEFFTRWINS
ncbi:MAG: imidazole glycerol phosphate synthase subunit HisH [Candidatus Gastranaerophilales bacterium]|nr:imidazole glycerol phosphate synthase subunit HisH [Candidatus Gastranaerophilales bacterium]